MDNLVYPREKTLATITLVLGILGWLVLIGGTFGGALLGLLIGFVFYLFAQSALIAYLRGNGVQLNENQFPELYAQLLACCERLQMPEVPKTYILAGNGAINAFATRFLNTQYVVLLSDTVDAMDAHPDGVRFYIGHELGHLKRKHLTATLLRWPVLWLPLLGAAYARACETTCDLHGRACCASYEGAARALAALAAGSKRWQTLDMESYLRQMRQHRGFWASFHELTKGYPWLGKRVARVMDVHAHIPPRNGLSYVLALFAPYAGRLGAGFGLLIFVYVVVVLAAIGMPTYNDYVLKHKLTAAITYSAPARNALAAYYVKQGEIPPDLETVSIPATLAGDANLRLNGENMVLTVEINRHTLHLVPDEKNGGISWSCEGGENAQGMPLSPAVTPAACDGSPLPN